MKLIEEKSRLSLLDNGFVRYDEEYRRLNNCEDRWMPYQDGFIYDIGHSRRGQSYYLFVGDGSLGISILGSEPDGAGGMIGLPNKIIELFENGIICKSENAG